MQLLAIPLFFLFAFLFFVIAAQVGRMPPDSELGFREIVLVVIGIVLTFVLHELAHGAAMKRFGAKPEYGVMWKYLMFYATAPGFVFSRNQFVVVVLTPLFVLSGLFILGMWLLQGTSWTALLGFCAAINASGAVGDMWLTATALRYPSTAYVMDHRDGIEIFMPTAN